MSLLCPSIRLLNFRTNIIIPLQYVVQVNNYAKVQMGGALGGKSKKKLKMGQVLEKKILPVETDPHKLVKYVCGSNIYTEGKDVEIKPDSEYPDWLWEIHTGPPKQLEDLDPETKAYWRKIKKAGLRRNNLMAKLRAF